MPRCLLLNVEPTPYVLPRIAELVLDDTLQYESYFVTENISQVWDLSQPHATDILLRRGAPWWERARRVLGLAKNILAGRYAVAHLAGWGHPVLLLCMMCLRIKHTPFSMESDSQLRHPQAGAREWMKKRIYPLLFRWPRTVLPGGRRQAEFFRYYGVPSDRITIAHMTVDVANISDFPTIEPQKWRRDFGILATDVVFLFVGRLEPHKGLQTLLAAFEEVIAEHKCFLAIVGSGALQENLARASARLNRLIFVGHQPFHAVVQWMKSCDVLVLPSLYEPWGLVVNEAMACGMAIIASDRVGAVDDLVANGVNGFVVPAADSRALSEAMRAFLRRPHLRRMMGASSVEMIKPWTIQNEVRIIHSVIHRMIEP